MTVIRKFYGNGFGNMHTGQKTEPAPAPGPPGPPFLPTSAESGVHVDPGTGAIRLGSNTGKPLLASTFIDQNGFIFELDDGAATLFDSNPALSRYRFGDINGVVGGMLLNIDDGNGRIDLGDANQTINGTNFRINDAVQTFQMLSFPVPTGASWFFIDGATQNFQLGDIGFNFNGNQLFIDDQSRFSRLGNIGSGIFFDVNDLFKTFEMQTVTNEIYFQADILNGYYAYGDVSPTNNGTALFMNDANQIIQLVSGTPQNVYFMIDLPSNFFVLGDLDIAVNGSNINIDDNTQRLRFDSGPLQDPYLLLDVSADQYVMGDINNINNGNGVAIDDGLQQSQLGSLFNGAFLQNDDNLKTLTWFVAGDPYLLLDAVGGAYEIGDINNTLNGTQFQIADGSRRATILTNAGQMLNLQQAAQLYEIGDISGAGSNTIISIDDGAGAVNIPFGNLFTAGGAQLMGTLTALLNNAGAAVGTLTNAPTVGNPTKWIAIDDAGTTRFIPTWT